MAAMSNKEIVVDLLSKLPEDTALEEIAREMALVAGIKIAREQRHVEKASLLGKLGRS